MTIGETRSDGATLVPEQNVHPRRSGYIVGVVLPSADALSGLFLDGTFDTAVLIRISRGNAFP
jgi:hypothetical protein